MWERIWAYVKQHRWTFGLVLCGLVTAILMLTINFWRTVLIVLLAGTGLVFGYLLDHGGLEAVRLFFRRLFRKGDDK